jgi:hypothetical protein
MIGNRVLLKWKEPQIAKNCVLRNLSFKAYLKFYFNLVWKWSLESFIVFNLIRWIFPRDPFSFFDLEVLGSVFVIVSCVSMIWVITILGNKFSESEVSIRE